MKINKVALIATLSLTAVALAGCSITGPNQQGAQNSGSGQNSNSSASGGAGPVTTDGSETKVDCGAFNSAVAALFPDGASAPLQQMSDTCVWGVGSNVSASAEDLGQSFTDVFTLNCSYGDDAETQYQGDDGELTGGAANLTKISGVGSAASYYDGGIGLPQVSAWSGKVACGSHLFISDAATVGLSSTGDPNHIVSAADEGQLAKKIAEICAIGWNG